MMAQEADAPKPGQEPAETETTNVTTTGSTSGGVTTATGTSNPAGAQTFDLAYVKELRSEAAKHRKEAVEAKAKAEEYEDAQKSELERANSKLEKAEKARLDAEIKLLRYEVAAAKSIPPKMVPLLSGSTQAELEQQADLILEAAPSAGFDGGAREPALEPKTPEQAHNETLLGVLGVTPKQL